MMELNPALWVLLFEALIALLIAFGWLLYSSRKVKNQTFSFAEQLVNNLGMSKKDHTENLSAIITENTHIDAQVLETLLNDVNVEEKALYRYVIKILLERDLERDPELLNDLQAHVESLAKPYCKVLQQSLSSDQMRLSEGASSPSEELELAQQEILHLQDENTRLTKELKQAITTVDNIVEEYTRVFNGKPEETELRKSAHRMVELFKRVTDHAEKIELE
jgi:hypothetical protein